MDSNIEYLHGKNWATEISREERLFCAHLYFELLTEAGFEKFIQLISAKTRINPTTTRFSDWDVNYEVCFYRDYVFGQKGGSARERQLPSKRTFDLCLFSKNQIIIIEAKAQQGFKSDQVSTFKDDKMRVSKLTGVSPDNIHVLALISSEYIYTNSPIYIREDWNDIFSGTITWNEIYERFPLPIFRRADRVFSLKKNV